MRADVHALIRRLCLAAAAFLAARAPLNAQDETPHSWDSDLEETPPSVPAAIVPSYRRPATGLPVVQVEAVRASVELIARLAGWQPVRPSPATPPPDRLDPASPLPWLASHPGVGLTVELAADGRIVVTPDLRTLDGDTSVFPGEALHLDPATWDAGAPWHETARWSGVPVPWIQQFAWPAGGTPEWVVDAATIDLPWVRRLGRLSSAQVAAFDGGRGESSDPARALVEWTRLALVQGIFNARLEPAIAAQWFGRAWLGAALVEEANPGRDDARAAATEWRALIRRYGGGAWGDDPGSRLLPEMRLAWEFERSPFVAGAPLAPIAGAFDYLIRLEGHLAHPDVDATRAAFLRGDGLDPLDRLLLGFKDNARIFESNQAIYTLDAELFRRSRLTIAAYALGQLDEVLTDESHGDGLARFWSTDQDTSAAVLWGALDQAGVHGFSSDNAPPIRDTTLAIQLATLRRVENELAAEGTATDPDWTISWVDAWPEVRGWLLRLSAAWRARLDQLGADAAVEEADRLWRRAGFTLAEPLPGTTLLRPNTLWQDGFDQSWRRVRAAHFTGRSAAVADELARLLESTHGESRDLLVLALHVGMAAGRGDEFMDRVIARAPRGFARDTLKQYLLSYRVDAAQRWKDYIRPSNTASANDYLARAEWAVRARDWDELVAICDDYHYGESSTISLLRIAARWWIDGALAPADVQALKGHLLSAIETRLRTPLDTLDTWHDAFDQRFAGDPAWEAVKAETRFPEVAAVSRALKRLREPLTEAELAGIAESMRAITSSLTPETYSRGWHAAALEAEQIARGRWAVLATQQFTVRLDEARTTIDSMVRAARPLAAAQSIFTLGFPVEGGWLRAAVGAGAEPEALAAWLASEPESRAWWTRESVLMREAVARPRVFAELLRRLPYDGLETRHRVPVLALTPALLATIAREHGEPELESRAALAAWVESRDFGPIASVLNDETTAIAWIDRNAPDHLTRNRWLEAWRSQRREQTSLPATPARVPDLADQLTAAEPPAR